MKNIKSIPTSKIFVALIIFISISIIWKTKSDEYKYWQNRYFKNASSYLDAQLWVKNNTPKNSLFMTDPTHCYGWRDFSERSSFGNIREWGYSAIAYNPSIERYMEGKKRIKEFGVDLRKVSAEDIQKFDSFPYGDIVFIPQIKEFYYSATDNWRIDMANRYGIDYFVMKKEFITESSMLSIAYQNEDFIVFNTKKTNRYTFKAPSWEKIFSFNFKENLSSDNGNCDWSLYPDENEANISWNFSENLCTDGQPFYVRQIKAKDYWFYTGKGDIEKPPSEFGDTRWRIDAETTQTYRITGLTKGSGFADVYIWCYTEQYKIQPLHVGRISLSNVYSAFNFFYKIPRQTNEVRIGILLRGNGQNLNTIFIDELHLEKQIESNRS